MKIDIIFNKMTVYIYTRDFIRWEDYVCKIVLFSSK